MKTYVFDIDGTVCTLTKSGDYTDCHPYEDRIKKINDLFDQGNVIIFHTARGMGRTKNNPSQASSLFLDLTRNQLSTWNVKFNDIFMGKPSGDMYIDDKGVKDVCFFRD